MPRRFAPSILREYDIRGVAGETVTDADAHALGQSFGTMVRRGGGERVAVGYDGRLSSPGLAAALVAGLLATGCSVVGIGLGPTPMLYFAVHHLGCDAGVMVTGSHNPPSHNGFKLMLGHAPCHGAAIRALGAMAAAGDWEAGEGSLHDADVTDRYVDRLLDGLDLPAFTLAWDCGNGAAGPVVERLTRRLPGVHHLLYTKVDGRFPNHHPDPTVEANLADLKAAVANHGCDFGLAFDGDGDRLGAVDGRGRTLAGDELLGLLAGPVLAAHPGATIVADVKASQALFDGIAALGGVPLMWKTGHSLIKAKMTEVGAPLGGEMTGHIMFADRWYGFDDGLYATLRLIEAVGQSGGSLATLKDAMPVMVNTPELRFPAGDADKFAIVERVRQALVADGAAVNDIDGVRVTTPQGWWLLRASNTENALTARIEATDTAALERLRARLEAFLAAARAA